MTTRKTEDSDFEIVVDLIERYHNDPNALNYILGYRSGYVDAVVALKMSGELRTMQLENVNLKQKNDKLEAEIKKLNEQLERKMRNMD